MVDVVRRKPYGSAWRPRSTSATAFADDIDALYLVGIGGGDPGPLLTAQADSGRLGMIAPGAATNTVDGRATRSRSATTTPGVAWCRSAPRSRPAPTRSGARWQAPSALPGVVGGDHDHGAAQQLARRPRCGPPCGGTRSATCGPTAPVPTSSASGRRTTSCPRGRCRSMRIDTQPYGLLPATSLAPLAGGHAGPGDRGAAGAAGRARWSRPGPRPPNGGRRRRPSPLRGLVRNPTATSLRVALDDADRRWRPRSRSGSPTPSPAATSGTGGTGRRPPRGCRPGGGARPAPRGHGLGPRGRPRPRRAERAARRDRPRRQPDPARRCVRGGADRRRTRRSGDTHAAPAVGAKPPH